MLVAEFWDNEEHYFQQTVEWLSKKICTTPAYIQQDRTDFIINPFTRTVSHKTGNIIQLTAKEFDILYFLISHKEQFFTKEQIYENVWGYDYPADPNNLTSFIRKLRKKIEPEPDRPRYIVIVRGVGYKYTENEEMVGKTATPPE
ncbi:MAG: winged helix-turn-helix domain-containing protein [Clostridiales bacterium]|nr:winged helix-turn-helix domain-containing protein [Clostridiales bacterium]